jgi:hypothetical protein
MTLFRRAARSIRHPAIISRPASRNPRRCGHRNSASPAGTTTESGKPTTPLDPGWYAAKRALALQERRGMPPGASPTTQVLFAILQDNLRYFFDRARYNASLG